MMRAKTMLGLPMANDKQLPNLSSSRASATPVVVAILATYCMSSVILSLYSKL